ncbi:P-loop containing nucleoside triphosphate hydrolase protein [Cunninghamella echinulata]|nr:P-loop containing nucleoside triphosphate hydrolase protein [Cunninghamella echinulata]
MVLPDDKPIQLSLNQIINELKQQSFYQQQLDDNKYQLELPEKSSKFGKLLNSPLSKPIVDYLNEKGIQQLYSHQAIAVNELYNGKHVVISSSAASGKSLIYQLPILEAFLNNRTVYALFLFPTKALAQDQKRSLLEWVSSIPGLNNLKVATYDGDTPLQEREKIRNSANIILTNPDMLHNSILPNAREYWQHFFQFLKYIIIDEVHVYHGQFGTHMGLILRRLERLLLESFRNDKIQFISCSATLSKSKCHMKRLLGKEDIVNNIVSIEEDGSPCGSKKMIIWNPSILNNNVTEVARRGAIAEAALLLEYFVSHNIRTIVFCKIRKTCELLMKYVKENLENKQRRDLLEKIVSYRGGYMPMTRRQIEKKMFCGELLAIIATNALELGIDIGNLDAVLMVGVPWSISAFLQQSGRAGRRNKDSLTMIVADQTPLDQFYAKNPQALFQHTAIPFADFQIENSIALKGHLQCAAKEIPIDILRDEPYFGELLNSICQENLTYIPDKNLYIPHPSRRDNPSQYVNIRGINEDTYAIVDVTGYNKKVIEEIEASRAPFEIYEGAIFIHQGQTYLVEELNVEFRYAKVHLTRVDWITRQRDFTNINILETLMKKEILSHPIWVYFGKVEKETVVFGYHKIDKRNKIIDSLEIHMDPVIYTTLGLWFDVPGEAINKITELEEDIMASVHSISHLFIKLLPKKAFSLSNDIKTECKSPYATRQRPNRVVLYESTACGVSRQIYDSFDQLVKMALAHIESCKCDSGCPNCNTYIHTYIHC